MKTSLVNTCSTMIIDTKHFSQINFKFQKMQIIANIVLYETVTLTLRAYMIKYW